MLSVLSGIELFSGHPCPEIDMSLAKADGPDQASCAAAEFMQQSAAPYICICTGSASITVPGIAEGW